MVAEVLVELGAQGVEVHVEDAVCGGAGAEEDEGGLVAIGADEQRLVFRDAGGYGIERMVGKDGAADDRGEISCAFDGAVAAEAAEEVESGQAGMAAEFVLGGEQMGGGNLEQLAPLRLSEPELREGHTGGLGGDLLGTMRKPGPLSTEAFVKYFAADGRA